MHKKCYRTHMMDEQEASKTKRARLCDDFSSVAPLCECNAQAVVKLSRTLLNPDRAFFSCASSGCDFFAWCSGAAGTGVLPEERTPLELLLDGARLGDLPLVERCVNALKALGELHLINMPGSARGSNTPATALQYAAFHGYLPIVHLLLQAGAISKLRNSRGQDGLELARLGASHEGARGARADRTAVVELLETAAMERWVVRVNRGNSSGPEGREVEIVGTVDGCLHQVVVDGDESSRLEIEHDRLVKVLPPGTRAQVVGLTNQGGRGLNNYSPVEVIDYDCVKDNYVIKLLEGRHQQQIRIKRSKVRCHLGLESFGRGTSGLASPTSLDQANTIVIE